MIDFKNYVQSKGLAANEAELKAQFEQLADAENLQVNNNESISPFWRVVTALMIKPVLFLIEFIINTLLPNQFLKTADTTATELKAAEIGLVKFEPTKAQGLIRFNRVNTAASLTIPKDTVIDSKPVNGAVYSVKTQNSATLNAGDAFIKIECEAITPGAAHNLPANFYTVPQGSITGIDSVTNEADWLIKPGTDKETDSELKTRYQNVFTANGQWFIDSSYIKIISDFTGLNTDEIFLEKNAPNGPGTANILILLAEGEPAPAFLNSIQNHIDGENYHGIGDQLSVLAMPAKPIDLIASVKLKQGSNESELLAAIAVFIRCAFRENSDYQATKTTPFSFFSFSVLSKELHQVFNELLDISFNLQSIEQAAEIARLNTLVVSHD